MNFRRRSTGRGMRTRQSPCTAAPVTLSTRISMISR
jgi:hypothetical protein